MGLHQSKIGLKSVNKLDWFGKNVLDIGCGDGRLTLDILKVTNCHRVLGVDFDKNEIEKAKLLAKKDGGEKLSFRLGNASDLSFLSNNSFDIIFCNIAFQQFNDKLAFLKEIFRVLKRGGEVILNFIAEKSDVRKEMDKLVSKPPFNKIIKIKSKGKKISKKEFDQHAKQIGFQVISSISKDDTLYYPTVDLLLNGYQDPSVTFPQLKMLPKKLADNLWRQLKKSFERKRTKQGFGETWKVVFAHLQKPSISRVICQRMSTWQVDV